MSALLYRLTPSSACRPYVARDAARIADAVDTLFAAMPIAGVLSAIHRCHDARDGAPITTMILRRRLRHILSAYFADDKRVPRVVDTREVRESASAKMSARCAKDTFYRKRMRKKSDCRR